MFWLSGASCRHSSVFVGVSSASRWLLLSACMDARCCCLCRIGQNASPTTSVSCCRRHHCMRIAVATIFRHCLPVVAYDNATISTHVHEHATTSTHVHSNATVSKMSMIMQQLQHMSMLMQQNQHMSVIMQQHQHMPVNMQQYHQYMSMIVQQHQHVSSDSATVLTHVDDNAPTSTHVQCLCNKTNACPCWGKQENEQ